MKEDGCALYVIIDESSHCPMIAELSLEYSPDHEPIRPAFLLDTGAFRSSINPDVLEYFGCTDFIEPCDDDRFRGTIKMKMYFSSIDSPHSETLTEEF